MKKTFLLPVSWACYGVMKIKADTLDEAIQKAELADLPKGDYIDSSFEVNENLIAEMPGVYGEQKKP
jgi:hypothetical protein